MRYAAQPLSSDSPLHRGLQGELARANLSHNDAAMWEVYDHDLRRAVAWAQRPEAVRLAQLLALAWP